ncbi:flagellar hook-length control protein FliK [Shewanella litorisediminis]|uniref:Flagellar hook-length control protein FliK n=2 Tax=Shewanella litorisediminis TaxID=1173586 RepID=A0ABX7G8Q0_9GAMM|nr:flagellar hook-length control protein FliK [Shewanella litorisediminis]
MQAATDGVIADNEQAIAVDALFLRFSALMKNADDAERDQIASQLGLTPSALTALDEDAFTGLLADNPSLKDALAKLLQTDIQGLESDIDAQEQLALFMQSLPQAAHTPSATDASLKSPSDNAAVDVAKSNLQSGNGAAAALTQAATRAPSGAKGLEVAMARVGGDAESDAAPIAYAAKADMAKADAGQTVDRGMASTVAADTLGIKGPESASPKDFSGIVSQASDASKPVNDEGLAASTSVREELPLKSLETIGRLAEPVANKSDLAAIETKSLAATESVSDLKAPSLHQARIHEAQPMTMSLRTAHERPMTQPDMVARFAPVMHTKLIAMVRDGIQQAEIRLDPPELGSMMVRIQVQGNETQVQFHVSAQQTKDVVEQAMPRLRELLAQQGMELTDGQVSHERRGDGRERQDAPEGNQFVTMDEFPAEELQSSANQTTSYSSGIDYYA